MTLNVPRKSPSLLVPADATIFNQNGLQVAVVQDGTTHIRKISVVHDMGTQLEVNAGVERGDKVILNPPVNLTEGSKVRAVRHLALILRCNDAPPISQAGKCIHGAL